MASRDPVDSAKSELLRDKTIAVLSIQVAGQDPPRWLCEIAGYARAVLVATVVVMVVVVDRERTRT